MLQLCCSVRIFPLQYYGKGLKWFADMHYIYGGIVMQTRLFHGFRALFAGCFAAAMAAILLQNGACIALAVLLLCVWACAKWRLPYVTVWLFFGALLVRVAAVTVVTPPIVSDFRTLYEAALQLNAGDLSYLKDSYFLLWAYQNAFVIWEAFWLRLWNDPLFLKLISCLLSAGTVCLVYRIARGWFRPAAARMAGVLAALCPFSVLLPTVLTNQIASAFFLVLGVWLLACRDCARLRVFRFPLAGLALACGNILRPEGIIVLTGILAWAVFAVLEDKARWKRILCGLLAVLAVYFAAGGAADAALRASGLSPNGLENGNPLWKFVVGLNIDTGGSYSPDDQDKILSTMTDTGITEQTVAAEKELIRERLSASPAELLRLFLSKIRVQWCDSALHWMFGPITGEPAYQLYELTAAKLCTQFDRAWFYAAVGLALFGMAGGRRRADELLPALVVFAAFCAFLLIEAQARYAYLPQLFIFLAAASGLDRLGKEKENAQNLDRRPLL